MPTEDDQDQLARVRRRLNDAEEYIDTLQKKVRGIADELELARRRSLYQLATIGPENLVDTLTTDIKFYKNLIYNSSFENPAPNRTPKFWTAGKTDASAAWYSTCSLKLIPGEVAEQTLAAYIDPAWYMRGETRVTFVHKFGDLRCSVVNDLGEILVANDYDYAEDWPLGKVTFVFDPGNAAKIFLRFQNIDTTFDAYVDAVQLEPNLMPWPSLYSDGPFSLPAGAPSARVFQNFGSAPTGWTTLSFPSTQYDTDQMVVTGFPSRIYCFTPGICVITATAGFAKGSAPPNQSYSFEIGPDGGTVDFTVDQRPVGARGIRVMLNGTTVLATQLCAPSETAETYVTVATTYQLKVNEFVEVQVYTDEAVSLTAPINFAMVSVGE